MIVQHLKKTVIWNLKSGRGTGPGVFFAGRSGSLWTIFLAEPMAEGFFQMQQTFRKPHIHDRRKK